MAVSGDLGVDGSVERGVLTEDDLSGAAEGIGSDAGCTVENDRTLVGEGSGGNAGIAGEQ